MCIYNNHLSPSIWAEADSDDSFLVSWHTAGAPRHCLHLEQLQWVVDYLQDLLHVMVTKTLQCRLQCVPHLRLGLHLVYVELIRRGLLLQ